MHQLIFCAIIIGSIYERLRLTYMLFENTIFKQAKIIEWKKDMNEIKVNYPLPLGDG